MIMDGWGLRTMEHANAVVQGNTPNFDRWNTTLDRAVIDASERWVGLVDDQMGNSEVGHLNLGAGRVVYQDISRIDNAIEDGSFFSLGPLLDAASKAKNGGKLHLIGLLGPGGVHAHDNHLHALLKFVNDQGVTPVLHVITDGRDTPPQSSVDFFASLRAFIEKHNIRVAFATVSGRYYIMDRDKRWERTSAAYDALVKREGKTAATPEEAIRDSHSEGVNDEFIVPVVLPGDGLAVEPGDAIVFYNFRADRMRQIVRLFAFEEFEGRPDVGFIDDVKLVSMTQYESDFDGVVDVLFPMEIVRNPLAEVLANAGKTQFHIAETEKYPHVTYFFNGRREEPFDGETRQIVPSPKVATYDLQPEMSAYEVRDTLLKRIKEHDDDFLLINFANPDMVGHTGSIEAAIKAVETVDVCAGEVVQAIVDKGGVAIVTADHGNCEVMMDEVTRKPHTYHTTNPVPLFIIGKEYIAPRPRGKLADVAPTVLALLGVEQPEDMTGRSLLDVD